MADTLDLFSGALNEIANGPHVGGFDAITKALMQRLAEKGLTLEHLASRQMMNRSLRTLESHAREYGIAFPDYVPMALRKTVAFVQRGDFFELRGEHVSDVAKLLEIAVLSKQDDPSCAVPVHAIEDAREDLQAAWYVVKLVRAKAKKAKSNG